MLRGLPGPLRPFLGGRTGRPREAWVPVPLCAAGVIDLARIITVSSGALSLQSQAEGGEVSTPTPMKRPVRRSHES
jgi:hypothetical protein